MRALVFEAERVQLKQVDEPVAGGGEVVLSVRSAGICNTDIEIARGYMGFSGTLGHELIGDIVAVADGDQLPAGLSGRRVVPEINCACGTCRTCLAGGRNHCPNRTVLGILGRDGGLAERVRVPIANLHPVPDSVPDEAAVFVEPLAAALHAFDDAHLAPGDRVAVLGDGKLGLLIGLALAARCGDLAEATAIGRHADKLAIVQAAGLQVALDGEHDATGYDVVVEATGSASGLAKALGMLRPKGKLILKSTYAGGASVDLAPIVINELHVIGSRCGDFARAIDALARGAVDPTPLIAERFSIADGEAAFAKANEKGVLKVLIEG